MVATRKSLPTTSTSPPRMTEATEATEATEDAEEDDAPLDAVQARRKQNALKKLAIDGTPALWGARLERPKEQLQVYHSRGASYLLTDTTRPEWIAEQPKRWRKSSSVAAPDSGKGKENVSQSKSPEHSEQSKRGTKRAREIEPEDSDEAQDHQDHPAKRPRRKEETYNQSYARPRTFDDFSPEKRKLQARSPPKPKPKRALSSAQDRMRLSRDYTVMGGHENESCIEHARHRARARGFEMEPLSQVSASRSRAFERTIYRDIMKLAKLNSKIARVENELMEATAGTAGPSRLTPAPAESVSTDDVEIITTSRHDSKTSNTSLTPPTPTAISTPGNAESSGSTPPMELHLPDTARGGQTLRWSLPKTLNEVGRAEQAIQTSRMTGESKSARRRRVKRELKLVQGWQVVPEGTPNPAEDDTEEGGEDDADAEPEGENNAEVALEEEEVVETDSEEDEEGERRSDRVKKYKLVVCRFFEQGLCRRGDRCTYLHDTGHATA